jgi:hypothetical protein
MEAFGTGVDELFPGGRLISLRRGRETVTFQDVPDRLIARLVTDVCQRAGEPVIPPGPIVLGETNNIIRRKREWDQVSRQFPHINGRR